MLRKILEITVIAFCLATISIAQEKTTQRLQDEAAIRAVFQNLANAWSAGDGKKFGDSFVADADFTIWNGMYMNGRETIRQGHQQIFDTIYKETKLQFDVRKVRFLGETVAVAHALGRIVKRSEEFPKEPQIVFVFVIGKENGKWQIVAFQNTLLKDFADKTAANAGKE